MSDTPASIGYTTLSQAREQGRTAALCGRPIFANPHVGADAEMWFDGYRLVPEAERGSQPHLKPQPKTVRKARRGGMAGIQVHALGDKTLPGSTPLSPFSEAISAEVAEARARTPKPWAVDGVGL